MVASHRAGGKFAEFLGLEGYERIEDVPDMAVARRIIDAVDVWAKDNPREKVQFITPKGAA